MAEFLAPSGTTLHKTENISLLNLTNHVRNSSKFASLDNLPDNLLYLEMTQSDSFPMDYFPISITYLFLSESFNYPIDHLPPSLSHLQLGNYNSGCKFDQPIDNLPCHLVRLLIFGRYFNQNIQSFLRSKIQSTIRMASGLSKEAPITSNTISISNNQIERMKLDYGYKRDN